MLSLNFAPREWCHSGFRMDTMLFHDDLQPKIVNPGRWRPL
jgi:hypothetical protein